MYGGRVEGRKYVVIIRSHQIIGIEEMFTAALAVRVGMQHEESLPSRRIAQTMAEVGRPSRRIW